MTLAAALPMLRGMNTTAKASEIKAAVRRLGTRGAGRRYPEAVKREVLAYLAERRKEGRGYATVSAELGIPRRSLKLRLPVARRRHVGASGKIACAMSTAQREMEDAMYQFAAQRFVYLIPGTATEKPVFVSSGTPIETAGGNVLVLTARHCARDAVDRQMRVGYHRAERTVDDGVFGVVHHPDSSIDVSVLVLRRAARDIVRPLAIDLNLVAADEVSPSTDPLMLAGFPAALV